MAASLVFKLHDRGPELVREVLLERGWEEYDEAQREEEDWNLYWRGSTFRSSEYHNLLPWQRLNHHPKTAGITRKDFLERNLRRMRATVGSALYDFSPTAFILPNDYTRFLAEYNKLRPTGGPAVHWICKPVDLSRGRGIFLFEDLRDLVYDCPVIVQRYISNPLLISGYKFDLRIYVCVKSFHPLTVYMHQEGLVRFATEKYNLSSLRNVYAHLTNTSINKCGPFYKTKKERVGQGCKWTMSKFRHFLYSQDMDNPLLWQRINNIVTLTLLTIAPTVPGCPNCVELFGFDILIDAKHKPWLLEVNYSPALTLDCQADCTVKKRLIGDLIDLMNYTSTDTLREKAYRQQRYKQRRWHSDQPLQIQALPLQDPHRSEMVNPRRSRQRAFVTDYQRHLPPVGLNQISAAKGRIIDTTGTKTLNLILGPDPRRKVSGVNASADHRHLGVSEVTHRDHADTDAEAELAAAASSLMPRTPQGGLRFRRSAVSWKLPHIYRGSDRPVSFPLEGVAAAKGRPVPPVRVGDFIRTFPFNRATLKASQHKLDVKTILQELHKLTAELASGQSDKSRAEEEDVQREEDLDSLFWGPRDPPLLRQCFKAT